MTTDGPFVDPADQLGFWCREYLEDFVHRGGASVKWLTGRAGAGKTEMLRRLRARAEEIGYLTAGISAREVAIGRIDEIYRAVAQRVALDDIARLVAREAARRAGAPEFPADGQQDLRGLLTAGGRPQEVVEQELREVWDFLYLEPNIAPPVASALRALAQPHLFPAHADEARAQIARRFLSGDRVTAAERRQAGISMALDRFQAREVLRSLLYALRRCGGIGLVLTIDDLEALTDRSPAEGAIRYTRQRRDDAYEALRELIDEGGSMPGLLVVISGRPEAMWDEVSGVRSYDALAMRVGREVRADRLNPYDDLQDLDELWQSDWPGHRVALAAAYGAMLPADREQAFLLAESPMSPLRLFLRAVGLEEDDAVGA